MSHIKENKNVVWVHLDQIFVYSVAKETLTSLVSSRLVSFKINDACFGV